MSSDNELYHDIWGKYLIESVLISEFKGGEARFFPEMSLPA